ncbi:hypothetical protein FRX31_030177, partial [Thalictrum thalictroides]
IGTKEDIEIAWHDVKLNELVSHGSIEDAELTLERLSCSDDRHPCLQSLTSSNTYGNHENQFHFSVVCNGRNRMP